MVVGLSSLPIMSLEFVLALHIDCSQGVERLFYATKLTARANLVNN